MKKSRLIALLSALMILAAMVVVVGCGSSDDDSSSSDNGSTAASGDFSSELINEGTLTVGTDTPYPPFEFGDAPDYNGFDVNLVDEIANRLGLETKWVDTSFDTIFTDVAQGKFDMVASASTITPDRQKTVNFSDPYYSAQQALLVPEGSDISSVEDLDGKTVGAQNGTTGKDFAENETNASRVQGYPNDPAAIEAERDPADKRGGRRLRATIRRGRHRRTAGSGRCPAGRRRRTSADRWACGIECRDRRQRRARRCRPSPAATGPVPSRRSRG